MSGSDYLEQAPVTNWPVRVALVLLVLAAIAWSLWAMRRGWQHRRGRQADLPEPAEHPPAGALLTEPVPGLFAGTGTNGDWLDRIVVHDLGVPSRAGLSYGPAGIWLDRVGARGLFVGSSDVVAVRADRGVAGLVRERDGMIVVSWRLGDRVVDTGFRADSGEDHRACLDGLMTQFASGAR